MRLTMQANAVDSAGVPVYCSPKSVTELLPYCPGCGPIEVTSAVPGQTHRPGIEVRPSRSSDDTPEGRRGMQDNVSFRAQNVIDGTPDTVSRPAGAGAS